MKDLIDEVEAAVRSVGTATLPAGDAHVVTITRVYPADIDDVWDALTNPERIPRWFLPVSGDLREGGNFQLEGHAGGDIRVCDAPNRLQVTWVSPGQAAGPDDDSIVEVRLASAGEDSTTLVLEHTAVVPTEFWDGYGPGAVGVGWDLALIGLTAHVSGEDLDPTTLETDPAMHAGLTASSQAWGVAYQASGADPDTAARVTEATTAFYVPEP
ncbi:SRPBCC family protein [soil metagenome]